MNEILTTNIEKLRAACKKHAVYELYAFGSVVKGKFGDYSDLDFAVLFDQSLSPLAHGDAFFALKDELEAIFSRHIDLLSYRALKNPIFKNELDKTKVTLYAA